MNFRKKIFGSLIASLILGVSFTTSAFANVEISADIGAITITEKVSGVSCNQMAATADNPAGVSCLIAMADGTSHTAQFFDSSTGSNPTAQARQSAIEQELILDGLMDADIGTTTPTAVGDTGDPTAGEDVNSECTSILPQSWCEGENGEGVIEILNLVLTIMTMGVGILATIGLIISGIQWLTARDKEDQVVKAKSRIFNIVIGIVVWGIMWLVLSWLLPGGLDITL